MLCPKSIENAKGGGTHYIMNLLDNFLLKKNQYFQSWIGKGVYIPFIYMCLEGTGLRFHKPALGLSCSLPVRRRSSGSRYLCIYRHADGSVRQTLVCIIFPEISALPMYWNCFLFFVFSP